MSAAKIRDQYPATLRPSIIKDVLHSHSRCCCSNANELFFYSALHLQRNCTVSGREDQQTRTMASVTHLVDGVGLWILTMLLCREVNYQRICLDLATRRLWPWSRSIGVHVNYAYDSCAVISFTVPLCSELKYIDTQVRITDTLSGFLDL